ncbi:MAG: MATE family efflux transporter [Tepidanaerobacteraceae bacterium]|nr:MATE family efflux transporter [Tepidanaerobacteraceae bacterium]
MKQLENNINIAFLRREIFHLAWPAIMEMVLHTAVWIFDTAMVGRLSAEALSAVGLGGQLAYTMTFVFAAIGVGASAMVARFTGAGETEKADHVAGQSFLISCVIGVFLGILNYSGAELFFSYIMKDAKVVLEGIDYMRIVSVGIMFMIPTMVINSALRGAGNTKLPMISALVANAINIVGDYVLIFGHFGFPRWEVSGAAFATTFAQICGAAITVGYVVRPGSEVRLKMRDIIKINPNTIKQIILLSVPASLEEFSYSGSRLISSMWIASLGTLAFAANQVAVSAESMSFMPGYGFSVAASTMVGQNLGAGREESAEASGWEAMKFSVILMGSAGIIFFLFPVWLMGFFTNIKEVRDLAAACIKIGAFEQPAIAISATLSGALRGAGDTKGPFLVSMISTWLIRLPLLYIVIFILHKNLEYVWMAIVIQFLIEAFLMTIRFWKGEWKKIVL